MRRNRDCKTRGGRSVFLRLLLITLGTGALLIATVVGFLHGGFGQRDELKGMLERNLAHYSRTLVAELGNPPDLPKAGSLAQELGLDIVIRGPGVAWHSGTGEPPSADPTLLRPMAGDTGLRAGWVRRRFFVTVDAGSFHYVFSQAPPPFRLERPGMLLFLCITVALILALGHRATRKTLLPLRHLLEGVNELGSGNLEHRIPLRGPHELYELSRAFNEMTERIGALVKGKQQLLVDVSHELRSPLTRMKLSVELAPAGPLKDSLVEELREMEGMVTSILNNERAGSDTSELRLDEVDLVALVREMVERFQGRSPGVEFQGTEAPLLLRLDPARARMALGNLLENALKYSGPGAKPVQVSLSREAGAAVVRVRDSGVGIPPEEKDRIFEPFYRIDKSRSRETGGFGLGLSICRRAMRAMGGEAWLESSEREAGSVFGLRFPQSP